MCGCRLAVKRVYWVVRKFLKSANLTGGAKAPADAMRFQLLDRIIELKPGVSIAAVKGLGLSEDYLADHFPLFPVMPGVFMLEAMTQASAWLIRASEDFRHSMIVLREARNVKYADFVAPGQTLTVSAEIISHNERETKLKVQGSVDNKQNVGTAWCSRATT